MRPLPLFLPPSLEHKVTLHNPVGENPVHYYYYYYYYYDYHHHHHHHHHYCYYYEYHIAQDATAGHTTVLRNNKSPSKTN